MTINAVTGEKRKRIGYLLGVAAVISMIISGTFLHRLDFQAFAVPTVAVFWMVMGAITLGLAIWLLSPSGTVFTVAQTPSTSVACFRIKWGWVGLGAFGLLILAESNANLVFKDFDISQHIQFFLLVAGPLTIAYGFGSFRQVSRRTLLVTLRSRPIIAVILITLLGLLVRIWHVSSGLHIMIDELHFYDAVLRLWQTETLKILKPIDNIATFPYVFPYLERWSVAFFGPDFVGMRIPSAVLGTMTIPALYLLAKELFNVKVALIAAALMATFPAEMQFSRLALNNIADPLFGTLMLAFLVRGLRRNSVSDYALAGICFGFANYFYEGGRLLFTALLIAWLLLVLVTKRPWNQRRGLCILFASALLVVMPYYYTSAATGASAAPRLVSQGQRLPYLLESLKTKPVQEVLATYYDDALQYTIFHTIYSPDSTQFYFGGYTGILYWYMVPFYFLGLFFVLWRWQLIGALLWLWLGFAIIGISFLINVDWTVRFCVMFPPMMMAVAIGLYYPLEMLWPSRLDKRFLYSLAAVLVLVLGTAEVTYYFGTHLPVLNRQVRIGRRDFYSAFDVSARFPPPVKMVYLTNGFVYPPVIDTSIIFRHLDMTYSTWNPKELTAQMLAALPRNVTITFALDPDDSQTVQSLREAFTGLDGPIFSNYESIPIDQQYALYVVHPLAVP